MIYDVIFSMLVLIEKFAFFNKQLQGFIISLILKAKFGEDFLHIDWILLNNSATGILAEHFVDYINNFIFYMENVDWQGKVSDEKHDKVLTLLIKMILVQIDIKLQQM